MTGQPLGRGELGALRRSRAWVRVTNPATGRSVVGRIMGLSDEPTMLLQQPGGLRESLPQRFLVEEVPAEGRLIEVSRERLRAALRRGGASAGEADSIMEVLAGEEGDPP